MQFYRLHKQPEISAKMLPDYALKLVNIREGWQILSDCGHALGLTWETQNKEYKRYHPNTWQFWKTKEMFYNLIDHYIYNLIEFKERFGETKTYNTYRGKFLVFVEEILPLLPYMEFDKSDENHTWDYLLHRKNKYITQEDKDRYYKYICEKRNGDEINR